MSAPMTPQEIAALCRRLVDDLELPLPLDARELCRRLGHHRGRRLRLTPALLGATTSIGHLVVYSDHDRILYEQDAPRPQQDHVIFHEVVHLVRGHLAGDESLTCGALEPAYDSSSPAGGLYTDRQEWEAETGATVFSELTRTRAVPSHLMGGGGAEQSIARAFGFVIRGRGA